MPKLARLVLPSCPHHIIQRGHKRQVVFASEAEWKLIRDAVRKRKKITLSPFSSETTSSEDLSNAAAASLAQLLNEKDIERVKKAKVRHQIISDEFDFRKR